MMPPAHPPVVAGAVEEVDEVTENSIADAARAFSAAATEARNAFATGRGPFELEVFAAAGAGARPGGGRKLPSEEVSVLRVEVGSEAERDALVEGLRLLARHEEVTTHRRRRYHHSHQQQEQPQGGAPVGVLVH